MAGRGIKAILHRCAKSSDLRLADPGFRAQIEGKVAWVEAVNPLRSARLREMLNRALE